LLLGYKPVQHVTVLNTVGNCNTVVSIIILYYNTMWPQSCMRSVVDGNVATRRISLFCCNLCICANRLGSMAVTLRGNLKAAERTVDISLTLSWIIPTTCAGQHCCFPSH